VRTRLNLRDYLAQYRWIFNASGHGWEYPSKSKNV
jgi:hypothetical protein